MLLYLSIEQIAEAPRHRRAAQNRGTHSASGHCFVKVYQMAVKFRTIHTGKLGFSSHCQATATAHSGAINDDGVHAHHSFDAVLFGGEADKISSWGRGRWR